ncbi:universal stress protein [Lentilactobacillus laojiaonis]|uniref:universal stress protein n=1 Tax=Lentilactobacillus laojiaonis TaxID=2883998 RepID=UPI001D0B9AEC|nr:universal stress protein [Lentilactobacillus laojiaonis]UDM32104.1 universal stress protein [Lentilactobacillus laojiaonis]
MYNKILVPLDGSENSKLALDQAIELAQKFNSELYLLAVVDSVRLMQHGFSSSYASPSMDAVIKPLKDFTQKNLDQASETAKNANVKFQTVIEEADPKNAIATDIPEKYGIDLIVMGKSGADALQRIMVGSTTAYVVRHADCNVMVISDND